MPPLGFSQTFDDQSKSLEGVKLTSRAQISHGPQVLSHKLSKMLSTKSIISSKVAQRSVAVKAGECDVVALSLSTIDDYRTHYHRDFNITKNTMQPIQ